jgi:hypothetical protein
MRENSLVFKVEKIITVNQRLFVVLFFLIGLLFFIVDLKVVAINLADIRFAEKTKNIVLELVFMGFIHFLTFI